MRSLANFFLERRAWFVGVAQSAIILFSLIAAWMLRLDFSLGDDQPAELQTAASSPAVTEQTVAMPALDMVTGKLLMEDAGRLFTSPNGHGGTLLALLDSGLLDRLRQR